MFPPSRNRDTKRDQLQQRLAFCNRTIDRALAKNDRGLFHRACADRNVILEHLGRLS